MKRFEPHEYAVSRLVDTVIMYKGRAFYVTDIRENLNVRGTIVLTGEEHTVDQDDPDLRFDCPPVGYINTPRGAVYAMRIPQRRWKQGIDMRALVDHRGRRIEGVDMQMVSHCLEGNYPKFEHSIKKKAEGRNPFRMEPERNRKIAFSKNFCIDPSGRQVLEYKGDPVGYIEDNLPILEDRFEYLKESLEEALC